MLRICASRENDIIPVIGKRGKLCRILPNYTQSFREIHTQYFAIELDLCHLCSYLLHCSYTNTDNNSSINSNYNSARYITNLNLVFQYKTSSMCHIYGARQMYHGESNWLHLETKHSTSALVLTDCDLWRHCTTKVHLLKRQIMCKSLNCVHFIYDA